MPAKGYRQELCLRGHVRTPDNVDPRSGCCRQCRRERTRAWRKTDVGKQYHARFQRNWARKNPESVLSTKLKKLYGLSLPLYREKIEEQQGLCGICGASFSEDNRPVVDHSHDADAKVRGLLCRTCNSGIGLLKDDPDVLWSAIEYLFRHGKGQQIKEAA